MIYRFTSEHIEQVLELAKICNLSAWTFEDYLGEINQADGIGFVSLDTNDPLKNSINGFIVSRLIKTNNSPSVTIINTIIKKKEELKEKLEDNRDSPENVIDNVTDEITGKSKHNNSNGIEDNKTGKSINLNECEILNIGVHPTTRKKGIGQKLLEATLLECSRHNVVDVWLEVRETNDNAFGFYRRNGFEVVYTRKNYYQNPVEDALIMRACLIKKF